MTEGHAIVIYRNFLQFVLKGAMAVGLTSSISAIFASILNVSYEELMFFLYIGLIGFIVGLITSFMGFWILFMFKASKNIELLSVGIAIVFGLLVLGILSGGHFFLARTSFFQQLLFPITPFFICIWYFRYLTQMHILVLKKTP